MMLRRGTGGYYVNGVFARFPAAGISLRDPETFQRAANAAIPDLATSDLIVRNIFFAETPALFQANTTTPATQFALDAAGNTLTLSTVDQRRRSSSRFPPTGLRAERHRRLRLHAARPARRSRPAA